MQNLADAVEETQLLLQGPAAADGSSSGEPADSSSSSQPVVHAMGQLILVMDALCAYHGEDGDLDEKTVDFFLAAARAVGGAARAAALAAAAPDLVSARWQGIVSANDEGRAWEGLDASMKQAIQLPGSRSNKRRRV